MKLEVYSALLGLGVNEATAQTTANAIESEMDVIAERKVDARLPPAVERVLDRIDALRSEIVGQIAQVDSGLRTEISGLRTEMSQSDSGLRTEIAKVDSSLCTEISRVDSGLRGELLGLRTEISHVGARVAHIEGRMVRSEAATTRWRWVVGISVGLIAAAAALARLFVP